MRIRRVARARLIDCLLVLALLVGQLPTAGLSVALAAAPQQGDDAQIWACQQQGGTLRLVADQADCAKNESAVNLDNTKTPVSVCVSEDDQVLRLVHAAKGGGHHDDCKDPAETFLKLPGKAATPLCA